MHDCGCSSKNFGDITPPPQQTPDRGSLQTAPADQNPKTVKTFMVLYAVRRYIG
jgi:hypothetical protein